MFLGSGLVYMDKNPKHHIQDKREVLHVLQSDPAELTGAKVD